MATRKSTAKKTANPGETERSARNRANAANRAAGKGSTLENHDANPDVSTDSSVRHAEPQTGKQRNEGAGGYPSGEYDVTPPAKSGDAKTKGVLEIHKDHLLSGSPEAEDALKQAEKNARLSPKDFDLLVEALPVGTVIEKEAPFRWRVHVIGQPRFGHGGTHSEAVESYILGGESVNAQEKADRDLAALPEQQQQEIADRDAKAAQAVGGTAPDTFARVENAKAAEADRKAALAAPNAATDGPEKASARDEAGRSGGEVPGTEGPQAK